MSKSVTLLIGNKIIFNSALKNCQTKQALEPNLITVLLHIYMASSVSVKVNWILSCDWLPEQARSLGFPVVFYKSVSVLLTYIKSSIDQAWSVKMTDIGLVLCLHVYGTWLSLGLWGCKKLGRYPAILSSHFAKNSYVLFRNNFYPGEVTWVCNIARRLAIIGEYLGICLMIQQNAHNSTMASTGSPWQSLTKRFSQKDYFKHVKVFKHFSFCEMIKTQQDSFNTKHVQNSDKSCTCTSSKGLLCWAFHW